MQEIHLYAPFLSRLLWSLSVLLVASTLYKETWNTANVIYILASTFRDTFYVGKQAVLWNFRITNHSHFYAFNKLNALFFVHSQLRSTFFSVIIHVLPSTTNISTCRFWEGIFIHGYSPKMKPIINLQTSLPSPKASPLPSTNKISLLPHSLSVCHVLSSQNNTSFFPHADIQYASQLSLHSTSIARPVLGKIIALFTTSHVWCPFSQLTR